MIPVAGYIPPPPTDPQHILSETSTFYLLSIIYPSGILSFASLSSQLCLKCRRGACCICGRAGRNYSLRRLVAQTKDRVPHFPCLLHHIRREHWPSSVMNAFLIYFLFHRCLKSLQSSIYYQPLQDFSRLLRFSYYYPVRPHISHVQAHVHWEQGSLFSQLVGLLCSSWDTRILVIKYIDISDLNCRQHFCCLCRSSYWTDERIPRGFFIKNGLPCLLKHLVCPLLCPIEAEIASSGKRLTSKDLLEWISYYIYIFNRLIIRRYKVLMLQDIAGLQFLRTLSNLPEYRLRPRHSGTGKGSKR
uniref:Uncharacterized protein n=1 Tax=Pipistrellus kuhlii TaxID=59472 RepID=A0A7J7T1Q7_PIPKU|nr:hypothetical protein mPipKuh1_009711 [Pipistrellus kuhlii]